MRRQERPRPVTVIAWVIIVMHVLATWGVLAAASLPPENRPRAAIGGEPEVAAYARAVLSGAVGVIAGTAMLLGMNWGRLLYLWFVPLSLVVTLALGGGEFGSVFPLTVLVYLVMLHYLRKPDVRAFFHGSVRRMPNAPDS